jgi:hypothetical protein
MRAPLVACLTACLLAAPVSAAARVTTYTGTTARGEAVGFKLTSTRRIQNFTFVELRLDCADGESVRTRVIQTRSRFTTRTSRTGAFSQTVTRTDSIAWRVDGRVRGGRASGTLQVTAEVNGSNEFKAGGGTTCASGPLAWRTRPVIGSREGER